MARIIDFPDGFTSATEPTTSGAIASFAESFANDGAFETKYGAPPYTNAGFYFNTTVGKTRVHDGTTWRTMEQALDQATASDPTTSDDNTAGYSVLSLWLNTSSGALFRAVDVTTATAVWTELAIDAVLDSHISDTSTHGIASVILGSTETQAVSNKTITVSDIDGGTASNTSRLTIPKDTKTNLDALTRKQGTLVYASDEDKLYKDDGSLLEEVGAGGGAGGGLDSWLTEDFEETVAGDFSTGNNATFLGGGSLSGVLSNETTNPISKLSSIKYVAGVSSLNDYIASPVVDVDPKQQDNDSGITFYFEWDGTTDIECVVWDETNSSKLNSILDVVNVADSATRYSATFFPPSTCTQVRYGFHFLVAPTSGDILIFDDVEFSTDPFSYKDLVDTQYIHYQGVTGYGSADVAILEFTNEIKNTGENIVTILNDSTNGFRVVAVRDCVISASYSVPKNSTASTNMSTGWSLNSTQLSSDAGVITPADRVSYSSVHDNGGNSGNIMNETSVSIELKTGDILRPHGDTLTPIGPDLTRAILSLTAQATTEHVITPSKSNLTDWIDYSPTILGFGTTTNDDFRYRRVGDSIEIVGKFTRGTLQAVEAQFPLPSGLTIDTSKVPTVRMVGKLTGNAIADTAVRHFNMLATGGDTYLNFADSNYHGTRNPLLPQDGNVAEASSTEYSFFATAPIENWTSDAQFLSAVPTQKVCYIKDSKPSGTAGGTFAGGSYQTRDLTVVEGDSSIVSLSANQFTLSRGLYDIYFSAPAYSSSNSTLDLHKAKLVQDPSGSPVDVIIGSAERVFRLVSASVATSKSVGMGRVEITSDMAFELQHRCVTTSNSVGFGQPSSFGEDEIYSQIKITKLR